MHLSWHNTNYTTYYCTRRAHAQKSRPDQWLRVSHTNVILWSWQSLPHLTCIYPCITWCFKDPQSKEHSQWVRKSDCRKIRIHPGVHVQVHEELTMTNMQKIRTVGAIMLYYANKKHIIPHQLPFIPFQCSIFCGTPSCLTIVFCCIINLAECTCRGTEVVDRGLLWTMTVDHH